MICFISTIQAFESSVRLPARRSFIPGSGSRTRPAAVKVADIRFLVKVLINTHMYVYVHTQVYYTVEETCLSRVVRSADRDVSKKV